MKRCAICGKIYHMVYIGTSVNPSELDSIVPGDSLRKIHGLVDEAMRLIIEERPVLARLRLEKIRAICSNENTSGKDT